MIEKKTSWLILTLCFLPSPLLALPAVSSLPTQNSLDNSSLSVSDRPTEAILDWADQKIQAAFSFNWVDHQDVAQKIKPDFNDTGYAHYSKSLKDSGITDSVINKKLILQLKKKGPVKLLKEGVYQGHYSWQLELPVVFVYYSATGNTVSVDAKMALLVSRMSTVDFKDGLAITQLVLKPDK